MKQTKLVLLFLVSLGSSGYAAEKGHTMLEQCKAECPEAKSEDDAHKCMKTVVKKKKGDAAFKKSECFHAMKEHEHNEKGHKH